MFSLSCIQITKLTLITITLLILMPGIVMAKSLIDPTRPPGVSFEHRALVTQKKPQWRLSRTLIANSRRNATINGKLVMLGDSVNGAKIIDIQAWNVTLKRNNKVFKVYLFNRKVHKKVSK